MLSITKFRIDPVLTPGLVHVNDLTPESAMEISALLEERIARYHLFTTTDGGGEDDEGALIS